MILKVNSPDHNKVPRIDLNHPTFTRVMVFTLLLLGAWFLWSGFFKPLLLGLGLFSVILTIYLSHRMKYFQSDLYAVKFGGRLIRYWIWLTREVFVSSLSVTRITLDPKLPISPTVVEVDALSKDAVDMVILANSITLTPGTLALDVYRGRIQVHALTTEGAEELERGEMNQRVAKLRR